MNRLFFFILLLFFSVTSLFSQVPFIRGYGLKAGITISNQDWQYTSPFVSFEPDNRVGFNAGVFAEFLNIPVLSIVTELNYIQKGWQKDVPVTTAAEPDGTGEFITFDSRLDYINISAFCKLRLNFGVVTPYLLLGPKLDLEINNTFSHGSTEPLAGGYDENRLGFRIGIGSEINLLALNLIAEILYDADFDELYNTQYLNINSNSIDLRIGIMF